MSGEDLVIWIAGTSWDAPVPGTDRRLATEVAREIPVLWVDPPRPWRPGHPVDREPEVVADGVMRIRVVATPGLTREGIRQVTQVLLARAVREATSALGRSPCAILSSFPLASFPKGVPGRRILYVTDDWLDGSSQLGLSRTAVRSVMVRNLRDADLVTAVSPVLSATLDMLMPPAAAGRPAASVLPNGCSPSMDPVLQPRREPEVGLIGQLNERLDLDIVDAVRSTGVRLRVVGPRVEVSRSFGLRLGELLRAPNVSWAGAVPATAVPAELARLGCGITPYTDSAFNRASFPLKTLEYLASGLGVVSTDLPSVHWLATDLVAVSNDPDEFADLTLAALAERDDRLLDQRRRGFAHNHSWASRAETLLAMLGLHTRGSAEAPGTAIQAEVSAKDQVDRS
jgi:teichuronic acid biosynthesis glycosyltransferase TuaH